MKLVWKLLRENISKPQLIGFFIANLIGMTIVLLAIQFYFDTSPIFTQKDKLFKDDYFTITKQVGLMTTLTSKSTGFTQDEIDDLKKQPFVKDVGTFIPAQYHVFAGITNASAGIGINTEMFFESVPDKFIDIKSDEWHFSPVDNTIPIILPKNYLDLYNFGFAESSGMPKISEGLISMINLDVSLYSKSGLRKEMKGSIVGFSNRINTILVPETFMNWANTNVGDSRVSNASRLIVEIGNSADPNLATYFKSKGFVISGENTTASKMAYFLKIIVAIVITIGLIICLLSFFILTLSIYLLLEKNMSKLRTLRLIGYSKSYVVKPYEYLAVGLNLIILILSFVVLIIVRGQYLMGINKLFAMDEPASMLYTLLCGLSVFTLLSVLNVLIIRKKVK